MSSLKFTYNKVADIFTIEGINYSGDLFRGLSVLPVNTKFRIVERRPDGVLVIEQLEPTCDAQSAGGK